MVVDTRLKTRVPVSGDGQVVVVDLKHILRAGPGDPCPVCDCTDTTVKFEWHAERAATSLYCPGCTAHHPRCRFEDAD